MIDSDIDNIENDNFQVNTIDYNFAFNVDLRFWLFEWQAYLLI